MAKSTGNKSGNGGNGAKTGKGLGGATDKLAELAQNPLARSMLAAGLVTAAAALTANEKVRQGAKKAGREAMDGAEAAADNASKVGAAILTAATEAVRRFMAGASRAPAGGEGQAAGTKGGAAKGSGGAKSGAKAKAPAKAKAAAAPKTAKPKAGGKAAAAPGRTRASGGAKAGGAKAGGSKAAAPKGSGRSSGGRKA
jgi:hypothetical protein